MKVQELVEFVCNTKNKMLKGDQLQQLITKTIEVKKYLSIKEKRALVEEIINNCILYEDGVYKFDEIDKYIAFTMKTIGTYTNIELSTNIEDDYDVLCEAGLLNVIIESFGGEYDNVNLLLQMRTDYILSGNNIEAQFGKFLAGILEKVDVLADTLSNKIDDFDLKNLPIDIKDIGKLMEFVNSYKK
jgi:hypothetical protein